MQIGNPGFKVIKCQTIAFTVGALCELLHKPTKNTNQLTKFNTEPQYREICHTVAVLDPQRGGPTIS